jgi:hypothetical protein
MDNNAVRHLRLEICNAFCRFTRAPAAPCLQRKHRKDEKMTKEVVMQLFHLSHIIEWEVLITNS